MKAVRQRGLMVGVELAPPRPGRRWGRRVCAGAVERGVLLRPLGDVVVIMPPLTITADEIDRIVSALTDVLAEVAAEDTGGHHSPDGALGGTPDGAPGAAPATP